MSREPALILPKGTLRSVETSCVLFGKNAFQGINKFSPEGAL